jgi:hypothetical protein
MQAGEGKKEEERAAKYTLAAVQPVDMFGETGHVETVVLLVKR